MYPLTIGLAIENRELWEQAQACLADLPFRIIVEHQDIGDCQATSWTAWSACGRTWCWWTSAAGRSRWKAWSSSIRNAIGDPMIIALNTIGGCRRDSGSLRAGINEYLLSAAAGAAANGPSRSAPRSAAGGATAAPRAAARRSDSSPPRAAAAPPRWSATWPPNWAARTRKSCWPIWTWTPAWSASSPRPSRSTRFWTPSTTCTGWTSHYWKALVSNGIPGVEIVSSPAGAGLQAAAQGRAGAARAGLRAAALRLDRGGPGPQPEPHGHGRAGRNRRSLPGDHAGGSGAAPVQADHSDAARQRLRQEPHPADPEPRAQAAGHHAGRAGEDAGRADLLHDSERLSGAVRNLRRRAHAEPRTRELGKQMARLAHEAGGPGRREDRRRSGSDCSDNEGQDGETAMASHACDRIQSQTGREPGDRLG